MKVSPELQLRLLDLQEIDSTLARLAHRRDTLPETVQLAECEARVTQLHAAIVEGRTALDDIARDQNRLDSDIETVRNRAVRDEQRLQSGGIPAKELESLQHEITTLARRQSVLEDELLEIMEQVEQQETQLAQLQREEQELTVRRADVIARREEALADIERQSGDHRTERTLVAAEIPTELLSLYEKVRAAGGGVGAAALHQRRCEGCRLELSGSELSSVRAAAPDDVLRCDNCRRILIRTRDSGL